MKRRPRKTPLQNQTLQQKTRNHESLAEITIKIDLPSTKLADTVYNSLLPETLQPSGFRSTANVSHKDRTLFLKIKARDIVALRAASNAFLRFVAVATKSLNAIAPFYTAETATRSKEELAEQS